MNTHEQFQTSAQARSAAKQHEDELLDEALAESFPASDPPSTLVADVPVKRQILDALRQPSDSKQK